MTRKDYVLIADAIKQTDERIREEYSDGMTLQQRGLRRAACHLADAMYLDNPNFDRQRFLTACGYGA